MTDNAANICYQSPSSVTNASSQHFLPPDPTTAVQQTLAHLGTAASSFAIEWIEECDSTNRVLLDRPSVSGAPMEVLVANRQLQGRGRRGREWQSWPGGSLTFSLRRNFPADAPVPAGLSLVTGLAVARALDTLGAQDIMLKWPNDVLHQGHKLGGILVELVSGRGRAMSAVIGIGINLSLPPEMNLSGQTGITDLASAMPTPPAAAALLAAILNELAQVLDTYERAGFPALRLAWQQRNAHAGDRVRVSSESGNLEGICIGIDADGALLLSEDGVVQRVLAGDVSLRPVVTEPR